MRMDERDNETYKYTTTTIRSRKGGMAAAKRTKNNNSFGRGEPKKRAKNAE